MTINYIGAFLLIVIGLAITLLKKNLIKIVIGMGILDSGLMVLPQYLVITVLIL